VGRRWNVDPVVKDDESPFMTFGNNPIVMIDPSGADWYKNNSTGNVEYKSKWYRKHKGYEYLGKGKGDVLTYEGKEYNKKDGTITSILENVEVTAKSRKKGSGGGFYWPEYSKSDVKRWDGHHTMLAERHNLNQPLIQDSDPKEYKDNFNFYQRAWQAEQDWRAVNYAILDGATFFVPLPKVGMLRWLRPFGSATGRIFWSGGGVGGIASLEATKYAILTGGRTLEMTTAGKILTIVTKKVGSNAMSGKLWGWASSRFAKGASGEVHMFMDYSKISPYNFWYTKELPVLIEKDIYIITHFK
jgi:hypothetical protein